MNHAERERTLATAARALSDEFPQAWATYVYGSFARGEERADSDLDLAVLLRPGEFLQDKLGTLARLSAAVGRDVDMVNLRDASLDLIVEILRDGRTLLTRDDDAVLAGEAERMSDYGDFNPRRRDILARYLREPLQS